MQKLGSAEKTVTLKTTLFYGLALQCHRRTAELHLFHYAWLHGDEFPDVAVEVLEAVLVHETVVFGLGVCRSSISSSLLVLPFPSHPQLEL